MEENIDYNPVKSEEVDEKNGNEGLKLAQTELIKHGLKVQELATEFENSKIIQHYK